MCVPGCQETVRHALAERLPGVEVQTTDTFRRRALAHWLFSTGAGIALIGGALLGTLVGTVIVAQTLYSSTKDHLNEFATLRALGSSAGYIHRVILLQAALSIRRRPERRRRPKQAATRPRSSHPGQPRPDRVRHAQLWQATRERAPRRDSARLRYAP